jgi:hypothetical protein
MRASILTSVNTEEYRVLSVDLLVYTALVTIVVIYDFSRDKVVAA